MPVSFQISDKRGDAILVVKAEGPAEQSDQIYAGFGAAVQAAGLDASLEAFSHLPGALANVQRVFPTASVTAAAGPPDPWGQPPVPAYQPPPLPAAAAPQGGAPVCQHGTKVHRSGENARGTWNAWACPAPKGDPTQCKFDFIR